MDITRPSRDLLLLYEPFKQKVNELIAAAYDEYYANTDWKPVVFEAYRSFERQDYLYSLGRAQPGKTVTGAKVSWHQFGLAVDLAFQRGNDWSWTEDFGNLGKIGKDLGLVWGGDFKTGAKGDMGHFQWKTSVTLFDALQAYRNGGLQNVWKIL